MIENKKLGSFVFIPTGPPRRIGARRVPAAMVYVRARPVIAPDWWPRDPSGDLWWVYVHEHAVSWSTIPKPAEDFQHFADDVDEAREMFAEECEDFELEFRVEPVND